MDQKPYWVPSEPLRHQGRLLASILVFLYLGAMIVVYALNINAFFEPPLLLLILNTTFAGLIPIAVSIIAARGYLFSGLNSLLFMGCGMMTFGCGAAMSGWLLDGQQVPNVNVTIMNVGALLGSAFHAVGAIFALKTSPPETTRERRKRQLITAYSGMFLVVFLFTLATRGGITPVFFVQAAGPTLVRQFVLGAAVLLFLLSALSSMICFTKRRMPFHFWYSLSLTMIALGLTAFFIQKSVGSPIGWLGRSGEYIGGIFALVAIWGIVRSSRLKGVTLPSAMTGLFQYSQLSYQALIETITDPIVSFDQDGKIILWNAAATKVFGYGQDDAIGASLYRLVVSEPYAGRFRDEITGLTATAEQKKIRHLMEITGKTKAGGVIPMEVATSAIMPAGDQCSFISVFRDITERKKAETDIRKLNDTLEQRVNERTQALQESQATLQAALSSMTDAVFISDSAGRFIEFNEAFATFHKFRNKEECAKTLAEYPVFLEVFLPNGDLAPLEQWAVPRALRGETVTNAEYTLRRKDTGETWVGSYNFSPIRDTAGGIVGSVVTGRDITERKRAEAEIRELNRSLEQRVQERTAELLAANEELSAFAYAVTHDLRAPLRAMSGFSQAVLEDHGAILPSEAHEFLNQITLASRRMGELIDGLLRLSRSTRGELRRDAVDLSALALRILGELAAAEPERQVTWTVAPGLTARGDERMLEVVLTNLLGNAWKYTANRADAKIEVGRQEVSGVGCQVSGEDAPAPETRNLNTETFCIRDNGAGFAMKHAAKLFQPFQRLHRQDEFPGIGIGLATVQRILHRHGGAIWATAAPEQGAVFCFSLPSSGGNEEDNT